MVHPTPKVNSGKEIIGSQLLKGFKLEEEHSSKTADGVLADLPGSFGWSTLLSREYLINTLTYTTPGVGASELDYKDGLKMKIQSIVHEGRYHSLMRWKAIKLRFVTRSTPLQFGRIWVG